MDDSREVKAWITINHRHIPLYDDESKQDAVNRVIANENKKNREIQQNKEQADKRNNKKLSNKSTPKEIQNYYKQKYNIIVDDSYFDHNNEPQFLIESSKNLDKLYSEFPILRTVNCTIDSKDFTHDSQIPDQFRETTALSKSGTGEIWLNAWRFNRNEFDGVQSNYEESVVDGKYPKGTSVYNILVHEMGHKLEYAVAKSIGVPLNDLRLHATSKTIVQKAYDDLKSKFKSLQEARDSISGYAGTNYEIIDGMKTPAYAETFAEAVSDYISNGDSAKPFSKAIIANLKQLLR